MAKQQSMVVLTYPVWSPSLIKNVRRGQLREMDKELRIAQSLFDIVTLKFSAKNQPDWKRRSRLRGDSLEGIIQTDTPPFPWLAEGTKRRHAIMSRDYRKRTVPGKITPGRTGGSVIARGSRVSKAYARRHRIAAGRWHHVIAKQRGKPWAKAMQVRLTLDYNPLKGQKIRAVRIL